MRGLIVLVITLIFMGLSIPTISADLTSITNSGTIFVGEENLNLVGAGIATGEKIGYWGSGAHIKTDNPEKIVTINDATSFYVDPVVFKDRTGPWYTVNDRNLAFYVERPKITLRLYDTTANFDATGKWVPKGDQVTFRIETNLIQMMQRLGVMGAPISIRIKSEDGTEYNSLTSTNGDSKRLSDIPVTGSPFTMPVIWNTGGFPSGNYIVWADCNVNKMLDNYEVVGETVSNDKNTQVLLIQDKNPLITKSVTGSNEPAIGTLSTDNGTKVTSSSSNNRTILTSNKNSPNATNVSVTTQTSQLIITNMETTVPTTVPVTTVSTAPTTKKAGNLPFFFTILAVLGFGFVILRKK